MGQKSPHQTDEEIQETGSKNNTISDEEIYLSAKEFLDEGKYTEANELFSEIPDYKDVALLSEQALYEPYVFSIIEELSMMTNVYESVVFHEISFWKAEIDYDINGDGVHDDGIIDTTDYPVCIVHYSCVDATGKSIPFHTLSVYHIEKQKYINYGSCNSLLYSYYKDILSEEDAFFTHFQINECFDNGELVCVIELDRILSFFDLSHAPLKCLYDGCEDTGRYAILNPSNVF